jgi:uncharacterized membrane protein
MRQATWGLIALLSFGVAGYAVVAYGTRPLGVGVHPDMRAAFGAHRVGIYLHVFASAVALLLGPLQFATRLRTARPALHRLLGRIYLGVGVLVGGLAGLYMAAFAYGGTTSTLGFGMLALLWLYTGARAFAAARARDVAAHRAWMLRNFSLALAAVTLRIQLGASFALGLPFEKVYPALAWLSWLPNLGVAEWLVRSGSASRARAHLASE